MSFRATGFHTVWYPSATSRTGAKPLSAAAQGLTTGANVVISGFPASISGTVDPGDTLKPVVTTVVARPLMSVGDAQPVATTKTSSTGRYTLSKLPAPASYELTFTAPGYRTTTLVDTINGGDQRLEPTVLLGTGTGQISGTVTDGHNPLGGVTISTTVGGKTLTVLTPTMGQVGSFVLPHMPTPATYVVTLRRARLRLADQDHRPGCRPAAGQPDRQAHRGHRQRQRPARRRRRQRPGRRHRHRRRNVLHGGAAPTTTTLTSGSVGSFLVNGLTAPGSYTMTFSKSGYAPVTIPVTLSGTGAPPALQVQLATELGSVTGGVTGPAARSSSGPRSGSPTAGDVYTTTSSGAGGALPGAATSSTGLAPGSYAVTASAPGLTQQTALVTVVAGERTHAPLRVGG